MSAMDYPDPMAVELKATQAERDRAQKACEQMGKRIVEMQAALAPFARMSGSYPHMHGAHVIASRGGTILDVNDLRRAAALVPDAVV